MTPVTRTSLTLGADGVWTDVDVTSYVGSDTGSVAGVILEVTATTFGKDWGVRKNGSTDEYYDIIQASVHTYITVGVDSSDIFEAKRQSNAISMFIVGYYTTAEAELFTNWVDKSIATTTTWTDIDISSHTTGTATCALWYIKTTGIYEYGLRENSSTDSQEADIRTGEPQGAMMSCDGSEITEMYIENAGVDCYLAGYLTANFTSFTNSKDYSLGVTSAWTDVDISSDVPADNNGAYWHIYPTNNSQYWYGIRKNGTSISNVLDARYHQYGWVEIDTDRILELTIENLVQDFYIWGYSSLVSTSISKVNSIAQASLKKINSIVGASVNKINTIEN